MKQNFRSKYIYSNGMILIKNSIGRMTFQGKAFVDFNWVEINTRNINKQNVDPLNVHTIINNFGLELIHGCCHPS